MQLFKRPPELRAGADSPFEIEETGKAQTFMQLVSNSFNYPRLGTTGFEAMGRLVDDILHHAKAQARTLISSNE